MRISDWSSDVCSSDLLSPDKFTAFAERYRIGTYIRKVIWQNDNMDIDAIFAANAPPDTPTGAIKNAPKLSSFFRKLDAIGTASMLAGLLTFPIPQANYRLEWAGRLALALGSGNTLRSEIGRASGRERVFQ